MLNKIKTKAFKWANSFWFFFFSRYNAVAEPQSNSFSLLIYFFEIIYIFLNPITVEMKKFYFFFKIALWVAIDQIMCDLIIWNWFILSWIILADYIFTNECFVV